MALGDSKSRGKGIIMPIEKSLHYYFQHIKPARISFAREAKGLTKKQLADLLEKKPSAITQFESGRSGLAFETFEDLVKVLDVHPALLTDITPPLPSVSMQSCHFRANKKVPQIERIEALCYAQQILALYAFLESKGITFPEQSFVPHEGDVLTEQQMEKYAVQVRQNLGLGIGPILNMAQLLENIGCRIVLLPTKCARLDAFATWVDGCPCIMIARETPASRMQFDYAHEFAHLLLDENTVPENPLAERRANRFASAFLMPKPSFDADCPRFFKTSVFLSVKKYWHVSIGAALYRARELGCIQERTYKNAIISNTRAGIRKEEPGEFEKPLPTLLAQALELLVNEVTLFEIADALALYPYQLKELLLSQCVPESTIQKMTPTTARAKVLSFNQVD